MAVQVTMHSKADCPFCDQARDFLAANGIPYAEIKHDDAEDRKVLYDQLGLEGRSRTVPQIILTDEEGCRYRLGGAQELAMSGIQSLFGKISSSPTATAAAARAATDIGGRMVVVEEGHSCCE
jgi:glutaredoxin